MPHRGAHARRVPATRGDRRQRDTLRSPLQEKANLYQPAGFSLRDFLSRGWRDTERRQGAPPLRRKVTGEVACDVEGAIDQASPLMPPRWQVQPTSHPCGLRAAGCTHSQPPGAGLGRPPVARGAGRRWRRATGKGLYIAYTGPVRTKLLGSVLRLSLPPYNGAQQPLTYSPNVIGQPCRHRRTTMLHLRILDAF